MSERLLFVYGSLLSSEAAHPLLGSAQSRGRAQTKEGFALLDLGAYPALVRGEGRVHGELYSVPEESLPALDRYEECPELYRRERIPLEGDGEAEAYLFQGEGDFPRVEGGDWRERGEP